MKPKSREAREAAQRKWRREKTEKRAAAAGLSVSEYLAGREVAQREASLRSAERHYNRLVAHVVKVRRVRAREADPELFDEEEREIRKLRSAVHYRAKQVWAKSTWRAKWMRETAPVPPKGRRKTKAQQARRRESERAYTATHRAERRASAVAYRKKHPERVKASGRRRRVKRVAKIGIDGVRAESRQYYAEHREHIAGQQRARDHARRGVADDARSAASAAQ